MTRIEVGRSVMTSESVLMVESDHLHREELAGWLEHDGYDVLMCGGPAVPDYTCLGGRGEPCPLADAADVVVLNMHLASDVLMRGTPGWMLLLYYFEHAKKIVVLNAEPDAVHPFPDEQVTVLQRPVDRTTLLRAVAGLSGRKGGCDGDHPAR
jgi:hypothetical protein